MPSKILQNQEYNYEGDYGLWPYYGPSKVIWQVNSNTFFMPIWTISKNLQSCMKIKFWSLILFLPIIVKKKFTLVFHYVSLWDYDLEKWFELFKINEKDTNL